MPLKFKSFKLLDKFFSLNQDHLLISPYPSKLFEIISSVKCLKEPNSFGNDLILLSDKFNKRKLCNLNIPRSNDFLSRPEIVSSSVVRGNPSSTG